MTVERLTRVMAFGGWLAAVGVTIGVASSADAQVQSADRSAVASVVVDTILRGTALRSMTGKIIFDTASLSNIDPTSRAQIEGAARGLTSRIELGRSDDHREATKCANVGIRQVRTCEFLTTEAILSLSRIEVSGDSAEVAFNLAANRTWRGRTDATTGIWYYAGAMFLEKRGAKWVVKSISALNIGAQ